MSALIMAPEWERIDLLGACLSAARRGEDISAEMERRLGVIQERVSSLRREEPWSSVAAEFNLEPMDQDILACTMAPEAEPRLGWMYQELQPGINSAYPTPALIREMFVMDTEEALILGRRLRQNAPLVRSGMIEVESSDSFRPIRPSPRACKELLGRQPLDAPVLPGAVEIPAIARWEDIVLPAECIRNMREYILWVKYRNQVEHGWGARLPGGPVALFSGPSGTGKTYAAEVIATALGRPLFRVDLGLLVSKYIGETEKNLNALFDKAQDSSIVLLFDEADSLFGRRGEVKEARDRYANMEVSHLLSRIERHRGPCILTTNLRKHIDSAFTRRFQVVVDFPRPDEAARRKLWRMHIPPSAPCGSDLDTSLLAGELKLTGAQIRNAALHAAFLAAGESSAIGLRHVVRAVWIEYAKNGGEISSASFGSLAGYLTDEVDDDQY